MKTVDIEITPLCDICTECIEPECKDCELSGFVMILGVYHHVTLIKVRRVKSGIYDGQGPVGAASWYDALMEMDPGGNFQTVKVPGFKGRYVCTITPFQK